MWGRAVIAVVVAASAVLLTTEEPNRARVDRLLGDRAQPAVTFEVTAPAGTEVADLAPVWRSRFAPWEVCVDGARVTVLGATGADAEAVGAWLAITGRIEFRAALEDTDLMRRLYAEVTQTRPTDVEAAVDGWRHDDSGTYFNDYFLLTRVPGALDRFLEGIEIPDDVEIVYERVVPSPDAEDPRPYWRTYVVEKEVALDDRHVADAMIVWDPETNRPEVLVELTDEGTRIFGDLTTRLVGRKMAILWNGEVASAPVIQSAILGGRSNISMGGGTPDEQQAEADALVSVLKSRMTLPPGVEARFVAARPASAAWRWGGRALLGALALALTWLVAGWLARRTHAAPSTPTTEVAPAVALARPLVVTAAALGVLETLGRVLLPFVNDVELWNVIARGEGSSDAVRGLSVVALGPWPAITAFLLVELIALVIPGWRARRLGTPADRRGISLAVAIVTVLVATLQGYFLVEWLRSLSAAGLSAIFDDSALAQGVAIATLVAGVMLHAVAADVITRHGLCNGWIAILGYGVARSLVRPAPDVTTIAVAALGAAIAVGLVLRRAPGADRRRLPPAGVLPFTFVHLAILGLFLWQLRPLDELAMHLADLSIVVQLALAVAFAAALALRRDAHPLAIAASVTFVVAFLLLPHLAPADPLAGAFLGVALVELLAGARRRGQMADAVPLVTLHDVDRADRIVDALADAGIPAASAGAAARGLLRFLGPYAPVTIHVPRDRVDAATPIVEAGLLRRPLPPSRALSRPSSAATAG